MNTTTPVHEARQHVLTATRAYLCGADVAPLYLAAGPDRAATALLGAAAARISAAGYDERLLVCTGQDFARLWQDTLRWGMTPFIRFALAARRALLLAGLEAPQEEPVAQAELARLVAPPRLVILAGRLHLRHVTAWTPALGACLQSATTLCLHAGPCVGEADAWEIVDVVAGYYGLTRRLLLSPCRTAPGCTCTPHVLSRVRHLRYLPPPSRHSWRRLARWWRPRSRLLPGRARHCRRSRPRRWQTSLSLLAVWR